ncbi:hypothetical protein SH1V18_44760 [Vallitalea longa]|uniref:Leucyl aminopeptidase n=1 Tax=Vallitalea longa TaxID=2936439 RepID=A0A9W6DG70_9FIRM|nr:aminopeptidase [Vallitalea longa]GKX31996.1 hypothetical protein SH1V18_44760 [Vallitalea longa]
MFDYKEYYMKENELVKKEYAKSLEIINDIINKTESKEGYNQYFNHLSKLIIMIANHEEKLDDDYFKNNSFQQLKVDNERLYEDILPSRYNTCYGNPSYAISEFGLEIGQVLSYLHTIVIECIQFAYQHRIIMLNRVNQLIIKFYNHLLGNENISTHELIKYLKDDAMKYCDVKTEFKIESVSNPQVNYLGNMIKYENLDDLRYLFKYGVYIGDNEIKIAEYLKSIPKEKIKYMGDIITEAFQRGFIVDNKDITIKSSVLLRYFIGFERIIKEVIANFEKIKLNSIISHSFHLLISTKINKQYYYDHRYDYGLYYDEEYSNHKVNIYEKNVEKHSDILSVFGGTILFEGFGEKPFNPRTKKDCIRLDEEQTKIDKLEKLKTNKIINKYVSRETTSFTIVSYPIPEIGEHFEDIFNETIRVNTLDVDIYEKIQQKIIDTLDKGEYVHVRGKGKNKTDLLVKLHEIDNPEKETNFHNCLADVNIPLGEVYTSPVLKGTNGTLFVEEVFLWGLKYNNMEITFKDGYVDSYTCTNFDKPEDNKNYIYENILLPNKTLPMGEFAIGTNTTAYVMANKYKINDILPTLIGEKTGPHFAIGDTCFMWSEDNPVYNSDGKEVIARDNEKSILRKTNIEEAYTGKHTDITLPYSELGCIEVITKDKKRIPIIEDERFVLPGTEELNKALDEA